MALTQEQQALLDLALNRGLTYEEIGELTDTRVDEVRTRTRAALAVLGGGDPGDAVGAFLLEQASAEQRVEAIAVLQEDRDSNALARRIRSALSLAVAGAAPPEVPRLVEPPSGAATGAEVDPGRRRALGIAIGLGSLCLLAGGLAIAGAFSGAEDPATTTATAQPGFGDQEVARIELRGTGGSGAHGSVAVGIGADNNPYLELDLAGLEPAPSGSVFMLWIDIKGERGLPLPDPIVVAGAGNFQDRLPLPLELAELLEVGRALEVVLTDRETLERVSREVARAGERSRQGELGPSSLPSRPGTAVLRGRIG